MTLPRLYEHVTLRAYSEIRYVNGSPEGYGSGSPFAMGLNTLVSRNFNSYIHKFRVLGNWREQDTEDYRHGRVPDSSMVLQIAMRAAIDRMTNLDSFAYVGAYTPPSPQLLCFANAFPAGNSTLHHCTLSTRVLWVGPH